MAIPDLFKDRAKSENWQITDAGKLDKNITVEADVIIIGTGAGGGVSAEVLSQAGLKVVMIEEGGLYTSDDFNMDCIKRVLPVLPKTVPSVFFRAAPWAELP